jgi:hypothetical protein
MHSWRWIGIAVALAALVSAGVVVAAARESKRALPVFVVLTHATIHANSLDAVAVVNKSAYSVLVPGNCGVVVSRRTSAEFRIPRGLAVCPVDTTVAPHSRFRVETSIPHEPPGKYWVWLPYSVYGKRAGHAAYTKLTVVGP